MSELTLLVFKLSFLIALWVFVFFIVAAVRRDLFGDRVRKLGAVKPSSGHGLADVFGGGPASSPSPSAPKPAASTPAMGGSASGVTGRGVELVIVSGKHAGDRVTLTSEPVSIGRSSDSTVVIRDDYTSTHHARLEFRGGSWVVTDLGSTNGTFLSGTRVSAPTVIEVGEPLVIGATTFEIRAL